SEWVCMSMKPGATRHPAASTTCRASPPRPGAIALMRSPVSATSAGRAGAPGPPRTEPPRVGRANAGVRAPGRARAEVPGGRGPEAGRGVEFRRGVHLRAGVEAVARADARRHLAEDGVVVVEVRRRGKADVELAARRVGALGAGHRHGPAHVLPLVELG